MVQALSLICSLLVALRGCGRGRWHDNGMRGWRERLVKTQRLSKHPRATADPEQSNTEQRNDLEKLF